MATFWGKLKQNPNIEAQALHTTIGVLALLIPAFFWTQGWVLWVAFAAMQALALYLEIDFDVKNEDNAPFFWNGALDLAFYNVGMALGRGVIYTHHLVRG